MITISSGNYFLTWFLEQSYVVDIISPVLEMKKVRLSGIE